MKDFRGKGHYVKYFKEITGEKFEEVYNEMSVSEDKLPVASTIIPFDNIRFNVWIFYETKPSVQGEEIKEQEPKKKLKIDL